MRLTNKQNLVIPHVPVGNLASMKAEMDELGLVYDSSNFRKGCVSCTGIEFCNLAVAETKNRMIELIEQLETTSGWYKDKVRVHFSGCPSSCGQHQVADIGFRGAKTKVGGKMVDAYDLFVGGRLGRDSRFNELLKGKILAADVHLVTRAAQAGDANRAMKFSTSFFHAAPRMSFWRSCPSGIAAEDAAALGLGRDWKWRT